MSTSSKVYSIRVPLLWLQAWRNTYAEVKGPNCPWPTFNHFILAMIARGADELATPKPAKPRKKPVKREVGK